MNHAYEKGVIGQRQQGSLGSVPYEASVFATVKIGKWMGFPERLAVALTPRRTASLFAPADIDTPKPYHAGDLKQHARNAT